MKKINSNQICVGTGLVALDVIIDSVGGAKTNFLAGGSCGNVLSILSYLGWSSFPIARLSNNTATELLIEDLQSWGVNTNLLEVNSTGSTPIIIHRILKDSKGIPKHRFEFRDPENGKYLPSYKPVLSKTVPQILESCIIPSVFYFDRVSRSAVDLATDFKNKGAIIFFEPSSIKEDKLFHECLELSDVFKFANDRISTYEQFSDTARANLEVQTLGAKGLKFRRKGFKDWELLNGYTIDNIRDTAGAGDWCSSGIIMNLFSNGADLSLIQDSEIINSLKYGQVLSTLNCTFIGARGLMYAIESHYLKNLVGKILTEDSTHIDIKTPNYISKQAIEIIPLSSLYVAS